VQHQHLLLKTAPRPAGVFFCKSWIVTKGKSNYNKKRGLLLARVASNETMLANGCYRGVVNPAHEQNSPPTQPLASTANYAKQSEPTVHRIRGATNRATKHVKHN
jgi:hypothetical protein